jgi:hypothetical protein
MDPTETAQIHVDEDAWEKNSLQCEDENILNVGK